MASRLRDEAPLLLSQLESQMLAQHRLALLGTMSAMIAHEFNNLMTPVLAYAKEAARTGLTDLMRKALERTVRQTERAVGVSRRLLELAHGVEALPQACSLRQIVDDAIVSATRPFEKDGIELSVAIDPQIRVRAEPLLLEQVLLNLLLNARQALHDRGGRIRVTADSDGDCVSITVSDSGRGISEDVIHRRINPFLAADASAEADDWQSVGLGLNVCRFIAQRQGARIEADATQNQGCTFRLRWPKA
jgi:two-component system NtrC family sensor kinase